MYAIVEIAGLQYKVEQDQQIYVNRLDAKEGAAVSFDKVLLIENGSVTVGAPVIKGSSVNAEVIEHVKGDKVIVFKKKRRKGYKKKNGHRQWFTKIKVTGIGGTGKTEKKADEKAAIEKPKAEKKAEVKEVKSKSEE